MRRPHAQKNCASSCAWRWRRWSKPSRQPARSTPGAAQNVWRIAASDYGESAIVLPALAGLRPPHRHPHRRGRDAASRIARQAEQGDIDLALHTVDGSPSNLRRRVLFTERYVLAGRAGIRACGDGRR